VVEGHDVRALEGQDEVVAHVAVGREVELRLPVVGEAASQTSERIRDVGRQAVAREASPSAHIAAKTESEALGDVERPAEIEPQLVDSGAGDASRQAVDSVRVREVRTEAQPGASSPRDRSADGERFRVAASEL